MWCSATPAALRRRSTSPRVAAGNGGFVIHGQDDGDFSGYSVSSAGDINGDGFDDLIIGAPPATVPATPAPDAGDSYVVFGHAGRLRGGDRPRRVAAGNGGFVIHGQDASDDSGRSVSSAGDINGDGFDDLMIGASTPTAPATPATMRRQLCRIRPCWRLRARDRPRRGRGRQRRLRHPWRRCERPSGCSVSSAGDINGDGFDDLIVGAYTGAGPATPGTVRATATWCSARPGFAARSTSPRSGRQRRLRHPGEDAERRSGISVTSPAISTATASPTSSSAHGRQRPGNARICRRQLRAVRLGHHRQSVNHVTHRGTARPTPGRRFRRQRHGRRPRQRHLVGNGGADVLLGGPATTCWSSPTLPSCASPAATASIRSVLRRRSPADADFRRIDSIESIRLGNATTTVILGANTSHAIDALQVTIDGAAATTPP